ncbi:sulfite exporter TauE/SafE family protein [Acidovorax sp. SUPP3334]|uniref:sulfite exporter TauE/SafE family protein n=1 Tax=Acidovorax sp. SUPP3334 TaxID=2920881 RepID=UPI0023DE23D5|nr:sulfite exporter TauE/SafE family protein [Acidovorax sp. SUPP3334]GKT23400.1 sulfite exporter TauE/SafE family protein [Acidovorax sp. SUPP3334]
MVMLWAMALMGLLVGGVAVTVGGGVTIGVPLLLLMGHSAAVAIATVKFALVGSFFTGTLAHRRAVSAPVQIPWVLWPLAVAGSIMGSLIVTGVDDRVLRILVAAMMAVVLWITYRTDFCASTAKPQASSKLPLAGIATIFALCVYSGFFGAGFGTFLIFALMHFFGLSFSDSASVMTRLNLLVIGSSVTTFITHGVVDFQWGIPLFIGCALGGVLGAWVARVLSPARMKTVFLAGTMLVGAKLIWDTLA